VKGARTETDDRRPRRTSALLAVAVAVSIGMTAMALATGPAFAQSAPRPSITVAATIAVEAAAQVPLPIAVGPPASVPRNSFVRVRGLPPTAGLSDGHSIAPGAWAIALGALPDLKITLPPGASGRIEILITLVGADGAVLAEQRSVLEVAPPRQSGKAEARSDPPPPASASILRAGAPLQPSAETAARAAPVPAPKPTIPPMTPQDKERAQRLMAKGDEQLQSGDVASARLLYERAADAGHAPAAMALAATYDAAELDRLKVRGIAADPKAARRWYERARELGAAGAEERLRRLGAR
jgi:hypothetical protein